MPELKLGGVSVNFPKSPYPCQVKYMEQNILALTTASNALLESPTGTGKTLCLLCSTLAWQSSTVKRTAPELSYNSGQSLNLGSGVGKDPNAKPPAAGHLIIYASRTHSQISQVVSELRATIYRPRMTVLGSRDQLCIHEKISKLRGGALNHACNSLSARRGCAYKNNLDSYGGAMSEFSSEDAKGGMAACPSRPVLDIEELVQVGRQDRVCPYFYSRDVSTNSEMVLLPYNYLLDSSIRKSLKLAWQDSVIIFDEGHNLEKVASDAASCSFSSTDIARCIEELQQALALLREEAELKRQAGGTNPLAAAEEDAKKQQSLGSAAVGDGVVQKPRLSSVVEILTATFELERLIDALPLRANHIGSSPCIVLPGAYLRDTMVKAGLSTHKYHVDELRKCGNMLMQAAEDAMGTFDGAGGGAAVMSVTVPTIMEFASAVERVFRGERGQQYGDYKVFVSEEEVKNDSRGFANRSDHSKTFGANGKVSYSSPMMAAAKKKKRVVNYWCFSPGIAMEELKALGVRSIILTSGTLSPMSALREDMKLPFPVQLENPHVIGGSQMWVGALSVGPRGKQLNSAYQNRSNKDYMDELGMSVLHICMAMAGRGSVGMALPPNCTIPVGAELKGGVLVFFPSYSLMEVFVAHWKGSGLYDRLRNLVGAIIVEPRGSGNNKDAGGKAAEAASKNQQQHQQQAPKPTNFMTNVTVKRASSAGPSSGEEDPEVQGVLGEFETAMKRFGGCVLMAVCRGKVSEGIDFSDNKGRVVIVTGIPFAPFKDPWVVLKKDYLDEKCRGGTVVVAGSSSYSSNPNNSELYPSAASSFPSKPPSTVSSNPYSNLGGVAITAFGSVNAPPSMWSSASKTGSSVAGAPTAQSSSAADTASVAIIPAVQKALTGYYGQVAPPIVPKVEPDTIVSQPTYPPLPPSHQYQPQQPRPAGSSSSSISLTGQSWYNQSASRAVNQCLGRVIRHKKDWGAVFLLDDRFMSEAQSSQLSSWMKPSLCKFKQFSLALGGFRNFLTHAMNDSSLLPDAPSTSQPKQQAMTMSVHQNPQFVVTVAQRRQMQQEAVEGEEEKMVFERQVSIQESALLASSSEQETNFIDPLLLLTQQQQQTVSSVEGGPPLSTRTTSGSNALKPVTQDATTTTALTLADTIGRLKKQTAAAPPTTTNKPFSIPSSIYPQQPPPTSNISTWGSSSSNHNSNSYNSSSNFAGDSSIGSGGLLKKAPSSFGLSSLKNSSNSSNNSSGSLDFAFSGPANASTTSSNRNNPISLLGQNQSLSQKLIPSGKQASQTQQQQQQALSQQQQSSSQGSTADGGAGDLKTLVGELKKSLSAEKMAALRTLMVNAKTNGGLSLISKVKQFIDSVVALLEPLFPEERLRAMLRLACLVPSHLSDTYKSLASQACANFLQKKLQAKVAAEVKSERSLGGGGGGGGGDDGLSRATRIKEEHGRIENLDVLAHSSKRAKTLIALSQSGSTAADPSQSTGLQKRPDFLAQLNSVSSMELSKGGPSRLAVKAKMLGSEKLKCGICNEVPTTPCANKCGHVCCERCWENWLRVKESCPFCRVPASKLTVTRLVIK